MPQTFTRAEEREQVRLPVHISDAWNWCVLCSIGRHFAASDRSLYRSINRQRILSEIRRSVALRRKRLITMNPSTDRIKRLSARGVHVPLSRVHSTSAGSLTHAPLVLIDLYLESGIVGRTYLFCYSKSGLGAILALLNEMAAGVSGTSCAPLQILRKLRSSFALLGQSGLTGFACAGIEMAAWDALAQSQDLPLYELLGAEQQRIPAYVSLGVVGAEEGRESILAAHEAGFSAVKFKMSATRTLEYDVAFVDAMRSESALRVMLDYNQALPRGIAMARLLALDEFGLEWIEEPCEASNDAAHAALASRLKTPIQLGENWCSPADARRSIAGGASNEAMLDVMKIGGVRAWLQASDDANAAGLRVSSHLFPEFSAHLLCATADTGYAEWLDLASPILLEPLVPINGFLIPRQLPGAGISWDERAVERYLV